MQLRSLPATEVATVAGWSTSVRESLMWCGKPEVTAELVAAWAEEPGVTAYGLYDAERVVAYGEIWLDEAEDEVELARLIVDPARRGQGIGRRLVGELVARATQPQIFMRVHPENASALRTYAAAGFVRVDPDLEAEWNRPQPVAYVWLTHQ